jgi:hypothetical protein
MNLFIIIVLICLTGLALDQEVWPEAYDSSYLGGTSRRDWPQTEAGFAFIRRPPLPEPLASRRNGLQRTGQQEMKT